MKSAIEAAKTVTVSLEEAWSEVERELAVRRRLYDDWVKDSKLSWADARDRYARLNEAAKIMKAMIAEQDAIAERSEGMEDAAKDLPRENAMEPAPEAAA